MKTVMRFLDWLGDESNYSNQSIWVMAGACIGLMFLLMLLASCSIFQPDRYFVKGCLEICKKSPGVELTIDRDDSDNLYKCSCKRGK